MSLVKVDKDALKEIAWALNGIDAEDLTRAEEQIVAVLVGQGLMKRIDMEDWVMCEVCETA